MIKKMLYTVVRTLNVVFIVAIVLSVVYMNRISIMQTVHTLSGGPRNIKTTTFTIFGQLLPTVTDTVDTPTYKVFDAIWGDNASSSNLQSNKTKEDTTSTVKSSQNQQFSFEKYNTILFVPSISVVGNVVDGDNEQSMNRGFWHYPNTGNIVDGGNIVIIGHRFLHLPPAKDTFYNLDKIKIGAKIFLKTRVGSWTFVVTDKQIITKHQVQILQPTDSMRLTLVTCHPLWTDDKRLVIIADLINTEGVAR